jgi:hypothetical protein
MPFEELWIPAVARAIGELESRLGAGARHLLSARLASEAKQRLVYGLLRRLSELGDHAL